MPSLDEVIREHIERVVDTTGGNITHACQILKIDRKTMYRRLDVYGLEGGAVRRVFAERQNERFRWAREHGCTKRHADGLASHIAEFRAFVASRGVDPDTLGDFARNMRQSAAK
jgi:hypothetical protein